MTIIKLVAYVPHLELAHIAQIKINFVNRHIVLPRRETTIQLPYETESIAILFN